MFAGINRFVFSFGTIVCLAFLTIEAAVMCISLPIAALFRIIPCVEFVLELI
jgi:hypothetical protein